ncbi:hypothetical protein ACFL0L_03490 [Patescibacteria group bacterium]
MEDFAQWPLWAQILSVLGVIAGAVVGFLWQLSDLCKQADAAEREDSRAPQPM